MWLYTVVEQLILTSDITKCALTAKTYLRLWFWNNWRIDVDLEFFVVDDIDFNFELFPNDFTQHRNYCITVGMTNV